MPDCEPRVTQRSAPSAPSLAKSDYCTSSPHVGTEVAGVCEAEATNDLVGQIPRPRLPSSCAPDACPSYQRVGLSCNTNWDSRPTRIIVQRFSLTHILTIALPCLTGSPHVHLNIGGCGGRCVCFPYQTGIQVSSFIPTWNFYSGFLESGPPIFLLTCPN